jgi:hypothetical protein
MRSFLYLLVIAFSLSASLPAALPEDVSSANQSLASGRPSEALSSYQTLLASPDFSKFSSPELWLNRGLAEEQNHDPLAASLSYRRALLLDPTLLPARTHLATLLSTFGIPMSASRVDQLVASVHPDLLILGGALFGWVGVFVFLFLILAGPRRPSWLALALTVLILGHGLSLVGTWMDPRRLASEQGVVMIKSAPTLHETPADSSKAVGTLLPGSLITILSRNGAWWKVSSGVSTGWLPATAVTPLIPVAGGF